MRMFAALSVVAMLLVTVVLGSRLLLSARQTRHVPELLFGVGFLGAGLGLGIGQLGTSFVWTEATPFATVMRTTLFGSVTIGVVALYGAIWRVFRPHDAWGFASFAGGSSLTLVAYGIRVGAGDFAARNVSGFGMDLFLVALISVCTWAGIEALHLYLQLRKRARLGLSGSVEASQIGLWGISATLSGLTAFIVGHNVRTLHRSPLDDSLSTGLLLLTVIGASSAMWCAFFPPAALRARLAREGRPAA